jgi:type VI secretion system secreted protein Hcp
MAFDAFLQLKDVDGESTDAKHVKWIEVLSFHWGVSQPAGGTISGQGGLTGGRANWQDFSVVKHIDIASAKLITKCATGEHIPEAKFEICKAGGDQQPFWIMKLTDVLVSSVRPGGSAQGGDNIPLEEVTIMPAKVEWEYKALDEKGKPKGSMAGSWDMKKNAAK